MSTKAEKQLIDSKIAKIREVVKHVSNNDIVLALHSYDMDVNKTIQALTTDIDDALGDWSKKGGSGAGKKNKKNKGKSNAVASDSAATSTTTETPKVSSVNSRPATQATRPAVQSTQPAPAKPDPKAAKAFGQLNEEDKRNELETLLHELDIKSARIQKNVDNAHNEQAAVLAAIRSALNVREQQLYGYLEAQRKEVEAQVQQQRSTIQKLKQNPKNAGDDYARLKAGQSFLDTLLETNFTVYGDKAIKAIEKLGPAEATNYPVAPIVHHQVNGTHQPKNAQPASAQPHLNGKPAQQQQPPKQPQQNGKTTSNKPLNGTDIKHSVSHSSLASENDSGLSQMSPVSQEKNVVAQVADGGFLFASDGLDASQLEKLKAQVAETLKAQGIDSSVLASIASSDSATSRPRNRPRKDNANGKPANKENKKPAGKAVKS